MLRATAARSLLLLVLGLSDNSQRLLAPPTGTVQTLIKTIITRNTFYGTRIRVYLPNVVRCIPYTVIEICEYNFNDLELGGVKVIQGQR